MDQHCLKRYVVIGSLMYAAYLTYICPCEKLIACHKQPFWISLGVATFVILTPDVPTPLKI